VNAIEAGYKLFDGLRKLEDEWNAQSALPAEFQGLKHPVNINLGVIDGGEWPSSVPTECTLDVRVGVPPGITLEV
jgi:acetylornithine deacetylase